ncbi:MAG: AIPR family protein [Eubacterium sp.]|nr:AIPR family protein [Eubacterium sp.]
MNMDEYRKDYLESIKAQAAHDSEGTVTTFVSTILQDLHDLNVIDDFEVCYGQGRYGRKNYRVDAYSFDEFDLSMSLFIADYSGENEIVTITKTDSVALFEKLFTFLDAVLNGNLLYEIEISRPIYDLVETILDLKNTIRKYRFFILTDKEMSGKISSLEYSEINGTKIEYNIWDISRLHRVMSTGDGHEPVVIDFLNITKQGLPCLEASDVSGDDIKCLLCVIPGSILADLYDDYGSRLLEGNVRSFLSTKGAVNKNIRKTILEADGESKRMFFAYNNGISATATEVTINDTENGKYIASINNLQIVNGGQTTASLSNTRYRDKAELSGIYVQMKLTVIPNHDQAQILIPKISRGSNSQNKVSDADFFSNHEFNIRMQQISRKLYAPAKGGQQYETHWFFERSRGQYDQEQSKMTQAEKKKYQMQNPKDQKITKTDFAKYQNSWREYPYFVSLGAQKNFTKFANDIVREWNKDDVQFNEQYFRDTVSIAILFKCVDKIVPQQSWYDKGYKANIVVYTLSLLHYLIDKQYEGSILNLGYIWDTQSVPDALYNEFLLMTKHVFDHITDESRPITNVTEWCKKEPCWAELKAKEYVLSSKIQDYILNKKEQKAEKVRSRRDQVLLSGAQVKLEVTQKGSEYWENALKWGQSKRLLNEVEISFLKSATKIHLGREPTEKQCQRIVNIEAKLIDEGFLGE